jgi:hypothetical protein
MSPTLSGYFFVPLQILKKKKKNLIFGLTRETMNSAPDVQICCLSWQWERGTVVEDHIRLYKTSGQAEKVSYEKTKEQKEMPKH